MLKGNNTGVRCDTYYFWIPTEIIPIQRGQLLKKKNKKRCKVATIVQQLFHQNASVITCQKKRKESPPNDPEASEMSPDVLFCKLRDRETAERRGEVEK